ncbi:MAG TPA: LutB/LldF family L-lactate oxidation iron-sulfur protein [Tepidisphaeraceae bacterium]|jgi:L-lactate dehydrogenase complex protein LldF|nr:LutB/LldF family L-lactate oxidation iron-sulfur protein [Tepidisphaeraceae bacterium]
MPDSDTVSTLQTRPIDSNSAHFLKEAAESKYEFHSVSAKAAGDEKLKRAVNNAVLKQHVARQLAVVDLPDSDKLRTLAGDIKGHALDYLDYYLDQLKTNVEKNGGHVHFASTADDARRIILQIAKEQKATRVIKSKSMVSEEINLAQVLEQSGLDVVETDLGEFIVQISHDKPSHLVAPIVHKDRASIAKLFSEYFGTPYNDDPNALTMQARAFLRDKFRKADFGMTGGNFLVAEKGLVCCVENEGNQRQSVSTPRVLVSLVGIEKIVPRMIDLAVMLKLLTRSATGAPITIYTNIYGGPRSPGEKDGPEEFHLVLIDNGRTEILGGEYRETLRCIRCGACLNACPIYRKIGGHAYGSVYPGPIGALITPLFQGMEKFKDLPQASSLCGACYEACPVKINIPKHLINMRRDINGKHINSVWERIIYRLWAWTYKSEFRYRMMSWVQKADLRGRASGTGWVHDLPKPANGWTQIRDMPAPAETSFRKMWKRREESREQSGSDN